jgi:Fur family ferric uptake transcriptional regulator
MSVNKTPNPDRRFAAVDDLLSNSRHGTAREEVTQVRSPIVKEPMSMESARSLLKKARLRCTSCRLAVLRYLSTIESPQSHMEVAEQLVPDGYDKSTIYRSLVEMADSGLLSRLDLGDHAYRFEVRSNQHNELGDHPHFVCIDCGQISCLEDVTVQVNNNQGSDSQHEITEVLLKGRCPACR